MECSLRGKQLTYVRKVCSVRIEELTIRDKTGRNASASAGLLAKMFSCMTSTDIRLPIPWSLSRLATISQERWVDSVSFCSAEASA
jgi:hypothetical protein